MREVEGDFSYNAPVTPEDLWLAVGEILLVHRNRKKWNASDVERHGGPNYKTVESIEMGRVGRVDTLALHCEALGLSLVDVLRTALDKSSKKFSPEALKVVRKFESTTVEGRQAMLLLAVALPDAETTPPTPDRSPPAPPPNSGRKS